MGSCSSRWVGLALGLLTAAWVFHSAGEIAPLYGSAFQQGIWDVWFDADPDRVNLIMTADRHHGRDDHSERHPLFNTLVYFPTQGLVALGLEPPTAVRAVIALAAGFWGALFFVVLRMAGRRMLDAAVFTLVALTSGSALFFFPIPETFVFSSLTYLGGLAFLLLPGRRKTLGGYVLISALTLSMAVTNWIMGLMITVSELKIRPASLVTLLALALVMSLSALQMSFFPSARLPLTPAGEFALVSWSGHGGPLAKLYSMFVTTAVVPPLHVVEDHFRATSLVFTAQHSLVSSPLGIAAATAWIALLGMGLARFMRSRLRVLRLVVITTLAAQVVLHLAFGVETFLFSLNFLPLLVLIASFCVEARQRRLSLLLAAFLIVTGFANNRSQFRAAATALQAVVEHQPVECLAKMELREWCLGCSFVAADARTRPCRNYLKIRPAGLENGDISDFDTREVKARFGMGWDATNDTVQLSIANGHLTQGSLLVTGNEMGSGATFFPGPGPFVGVDLSDYRGISFMARGSISNARIYFFSYDKAPLELEKGFRGRDFSLTRDWARHEFKFEDFGLDGHDIGLISVASMEPGPFEFQLDDIRLTK